MTPAPLHERMQHDASTLFALAWDEDITLAALRERIRDHASSISSFAHELQQAGGANPQANALLDRVKRNGNFSYVYRAPAGGLPDGYLLVIEHAQDGPFGFECGVAPDGSVSS